LREAGAHLGKQDFIGKA